MSAVRLQDDPWRRLPWLLPAALVIATLSLMGFLKLLTQFPDRPLVPKPIEVEVVDLPAPAPPSPALAAPPEPVIQQPPPLPDPVPLAKEEPPEPVAVPPPKEGPPPEPLPEPAIEVKPPPTPPLPRPQRQTPPRPPPRQQSARPAPVPPTPQPEAPPATAAPTNPQLATPQPLAGGSIGARAIFQPMPQIPDALRQRRIDAVAIVVFHVAPDGSATVELREATDDPRLNQILLEGFKRWRFFPALERDKPVASILELRVPIQVR